MIAAAVTAFRKLDIKDAGRKGGGGFPGLGRELGAGFVAALPALTNCFAYGALIFSGPLRPFLAEGVAAALMTCAAAALVVALTSRFRTAIASPSASTSALLAVLMASAAPAMEGLPPSQRLALAYAVLFVATAAASAALLLVGFIRAGKLFRFVPYPVIAGFMGATGWLMVADAIKMVTEVPIELRSLPDFAQPREGVLLAILLAWTALLWVVTKKIKHLLALPAALVLAALATGLVLPILGISGKEAHAQGILFYVGNTGWPGIPVLSGAYFHVDWKALLPMGGAIGALTLIAVLQPLFLASGLEISTRTEVDLDRELRNMGWANLASAVLGGFVGQVSLSATTANRSAGGTSRLTGIVVSLIALFSLFGVGAVLEFIPSFVLGGVLLMQGLRLLQEWAVTSYRALPRLEWVLVIAIIVITAWFGFVPAEFSGLLAACVLFALSVSRVDIVRAVTGLDARASSVVRSEEETRLLAEHGSRAQVMELRGFVFFGSAYHLRGKVKAILADHQPLVLIFDFGRVIGVDSSAVSAMVGISRLLADKGVQQLVTGLSPAAMQVLRESGGLDKTVVISADIDEALERGEEAVLAACASRAAVNPPFFDWLASMLGSAEFAATLQRHLVKAKHDRGSYLCRHGDPTDDLYLIEQGQLCAIVEQGVSAPTRVRVFGPHTLVGEIAFVLGVPRTASLRVEEDAIVWSLDRRAFGELLKSDASLVLALLQDVLRVQAERLAFATRQIAALRR